MDNPQYHNKIVSLANTHQEYCNCTMHSNSKNNQFAQIVPQIYRKLRKYEEDYEFCEKCQRFILKGNLCAMIKGDLVMFTFDLIVQGYKNNTSAKILLYQKNMISKYYIRGNLEKCCRVIQTINRLQFYLSIANYNKDQRENKIKMSKYSEHTEKKYFDDLIKGDFVTNGQLCYNLRRITGLLKTIKSN